MNTLMWNPNIHPFTEYQKRMNTLIKYNEDTDISYTFLDEYGLRPFLVMASATEDRCAGCYAIRLERLAKHAADNGFTHISTTLLYSRRQKHELIKTLGEEAAKRHGVEFWYEDYRQGWQMGIELSKRLGMYRQQYCGCIFSEEERFLRRS